MPLSLHVMYPTADDTTFDHAYYVATHMPIVAEHMGPHFDSITVVKGLAGGPDTPPGFHTVAAMVFADQAALDAGLAAAGPALADIPNFFSGKPEMLIGDVQA